MTEERFVLDASALLALLNREPGSDLVAALLPAALLSTVNWSEVMQKATAHGVDTDGLREELEAVGLGLVPFGTAEAEVAADLWLRGGRALSLADRACLATASVRGLTAVTADRAWTSPGIGVPVRVCR